MAARQILVDRMTSSGRIQHRISDPVRSFSLFFTYCWLYIYRYIKKGSKVATTCRYNTLITFSLFSLSLFLSLGKKFLNKWRTKWKEHNIPLDISWQLFSLSVTMLAGAGREVRPLVFVLWRCLGNRSIRFEPIEIRRPASKRQDWSSRCVRTKNEVKKKRAGIPHLR